MRVNKKREIISAVTKLFSEKGYMLSMSEIANEVGIKVSSIYTHYQGKDEIVFLSIKEEVNSYYDYLNEVIEKLENFSTKDTLEILIEKIIENFSSKEKIRYWNNIYLVSNNSLYKQCLEAIDERALIYIEKLKLIFKQGIKQDEIKIENIDGALYLYMSMVEGMLKGMLLRGEKSKEYNTYIWEAYWNGIKKDKN